MSYCFLPFSSRAAETNVPTAAWMDWGARAGQNEPSFMVIEIYGLSPQQVPSTLPLSLKARCAPDARWGLKTKGYFVIPHNWHLQDKQWLQVFAFKEQPQKMIGFQRGFSSKERGSKPPVQCCCLVWGTDSCWHASRLPWWGLSNGPSQSSILPWLAHCLRRDGNSDGAWFEKENNCFLRSNIGLSPKEQTSQQPLLVWPRGNNDWFQTWAIKWTWSVCVNPRHCSFGQKAVSRGPELCAILGNIYHKYWFLRPPPRPPSLSFNHIRFRSWFNIDGIDCLTQSCQFLSGAFSFSA